MRSAGVLMHITSIPSKYGIGTIGKEAYRFADFLCQAGQSYWQILPIGPTSYGDSPYQSFSTFAGNHYLIDLDMLCKEGLLKREEVESIDWYDSEDSVSYEKVFNGKTLILKKAFDRFKKSYQTDFEIFCKQNSDWLEDYALFMALKVNFNMLEWTKWPDENIRLRRKESVEAYKEILSEEIHFWKFVQFKFFEQWKKFKDYTNSRNISIIGDIPIYVAMDSADTWAHSEVFWIDENKRPVCVAGCPPDYFSETGQLWGNPLYNWSYLEKTGYKWWMDRIKFISKLFNVTRIDHFRAFDSYYAIPYPADNALDGKWLKGPGIEFFKKLKTVIGDVPIIAEDLGFLTNSVEKLLSDTGYPGLKILQFAFDSKKENQYLPHRYNQNCVVYTGTHDNETLQSFLENVNKDDLDFAIEYGKLTAEEGYDWGIIRLAYSSVSNMAIVQMQDLLGLSSECRMNTPSTMGINWKWRMKRGANTPELALKLRNLSKLYGRLENDLDMSDKIMENMSLEANNTYCKKLEDLSTSQIHNVLGKVIMGKISDNWKKSKSMQLSSRRAYYFSAEFLMGRMVYNNLYAMGILDRTKKLFSEKGLDINIFEDIDDTALGNGGLGRLAACFLDSAVTHNIPLIGYGIRYKYGIFKQEIEDGMQVEYADNWQKFGDPWSIRHDEDIVKVVFSDQVVHAVPYDMAILGPNTKTINTLRLWQSEPVNEFDFEKFNEQEYIESVSERDNAENISRVLYPNDRTKSGKILRLKQQYFFTSASIQDIIKHYKIENGKDLSSLPDMVIMQLNDTHPVIAIPEMIRVLMIEGFDFESAFKMTRKMFAYTNHTVMAEALESWDTELIEELIPDVYEIIKKIESRLESEFSKFPDSKLSTMKIINNKKVYMTNLAVYASSYTNGVAKIHTEILKKELLKDWYSVYPDRFQNKTNGITQRRWLALCNPELSSLITESIGDGWICNLEELADFKRFIDDDRIIERFGKIKYEKKCQLADYIFKFDNVKINPSFMFDVHVKRMHEYKRQLLNAFSIMAIYFRLKSGELKDFNPTVFIFGAKAAPGYRRAKAIIKYINEIATKVNNDSDVNNKIKVVFVSNYNCSYAEKIMPAADVSEQISTAGTEASGTGNMKLMLNGTVTLGTFDGANVEIVEMAGKENNYIFGATVEEINSIKDSYDPRKLYEENEEIRKVVDTLIDGTFSDGGLTGVGSFKELYDSLLIGAEWHEPDNYFLLYDFIPYLEKKLEVNRDYSNKKEFNKKCLINTASAGMFSSDRTVKEYAKQIWNLK